jgi:hypothetical protein
VHYGSVFERLRAGPGIENLSLRVSPCQRCGASTSAGPPRGEACPGQARTGRQSAGRASARRSAILCPTTRAAERPGGRST